MSYKITQTHGMFAVGGWRNLKKGISYKVNLKHLLICLFIELIVVVITNLILFKIDKSYENKIILFYLFISIIIHFLFL